MGISIVIVRGIAEELARRGFEPSKVLASAGLPADLLEDPLEFLDMSSYADLVDAVIATTQDPEIGLMAGANGNASALHVIGHAVLACGTLREAADLFLRYVPLVLENATFSLREEGARAVFTYTHPVVAARHAAYDAEYCLAFVHSVGQRFVPHGVAREIRFRHFPMTRDDSKHVRVFGCPVRFGCEENAIVFDRQHLDARQHHADPALLEVLREHAETLLARRKHPARLPARIRELVRRSEAPAAIDVATIADNLGLGVRTLRRQLDRSGQGVREIVESTKREMAESLLRDPDLPIKEIAFRLGFSEPSAFHRAFKRWTGLTPAEFRGRTRVRDAEPPRYEPHPSIARSRPRESVRVPRESGTSGVHEALVTTSTAARAG